MRRVRWIRRVRWVRRVSEWVGEWPSGQGGQLFPTFLSYQLVNNIEILSDSAMTIYLKIYILARKWLTTQIQFSLYSIYKFVVMEFNIKKDLLTTRSYNFNIITIYTSGAGDDNIKLHAPRTLLYNTSNYFFNKLIRSPKKFKISDLDYKNYPLYLLVTFFN